VNSLINFSRKESFMVFLSHQGNAHRAGGGINRSQKLV
jgi:hypothetical protein